MPPRSRPPRPPGSRRPSRNPNRWRDDGWPATSTPIAVDGGLKARSQRGRIGDTWWSQRFIASLEAVGVGGRLQRGKRYARLGQVLEMDVAPGQVRASVQGSRTKPYRVFIETPVLSTAEWDRIEEAMAKKAVFTARLLADEMPDEIEEAFTDCSRSLFPTPEDGFDSACSCPDWENPCKHVAAVTYLLAEAFDDDPFLIFAWRGRRKDELLDGLRARRRKKGNPSEREVEAKADTTPRRGPYGWPAIDPGSVSPTDPGSPTFPWRGNEEVADLEIRPRRSAVPDLLLRQLDPAPLGPDSAAIVDRLRPLYEVVTSAVMETEPEE